MGNSKLIKLYQGLPREIYFLFAARVINTMGSFVVPLITMILTRKIGLSASQTGLFSTALAVTQAPCLIIGGKLIDAVGRKRIILIFNTLGSAFYLICALMRPGLPMAVMIVIASDLYIFAWPAFDAIVADLTEGTARKNAFSLLYLGANLGFAVGPVLGGILFNHYLPILFLLDGATTLISTSLLLFIKETRKASPATEETKPDEIMADTNTLQVFLKFPIILFFMLIALFYHFTYVQWGFILPLQMNSLFNSAGPRIYGSLITVNGLIVIFFTPLFTRLAARVHTLRAIAGGGALFSLAFVLLALARSLPFFYLAIALFTFGEIITTINSSAFIADNTPPTHRGRINSASNLIRGTGFAIGPFVMGYILQSTNYFISWIVIAALMFVGFGLMLLLDRNQKNVKALSQG